VIKCNIWANIVCAGRYNWNWKCVSISTCMWQEKIWCLTANNCKHPPIIGPSNCCTWSSAWKTRFSLRAKAIAKSLHTGKCSCEFKIAMCRKMLLQTSCVYKCLVPFGHVNCNFCAVFLHSFSCFFTVLYSLKRGYECGVYFRKLGAGTILSINPFQDVDEMFKLKVECCCNCPVHSCETLQDRDIFHWFIKMFSLKFLFSGHACLPHGINVWSSIYACSRLCYCWKSFARHSEFHGWFWPVSYHQWRKRCWESMPGWAFVNFFTFFWQMQKSIV